MNRLSLFILLPLYIITTLNSANDSIKIVFNSGTPPLKFINSNSKPDGLLIDIWRLWAKKNSINIELIEAPWNETLQMIRTGEADIHAGLYYTKERDLFLDYTTLPLYKSRNYFFYHKSLPNIKSNSSFTPYVIGVDNGYSREFISLKYSNLNVHYYNTTQELHHGAFNSEIKVLLSPIANLIYSLKIANLEDDFKYLASQPAFIKNYYGAVKDGNHKLLKMINDGFKHISAQELQVIEDKWLKNLDDSFFRNLKITFSKEQMQWLEEISIQVLIIILIIILSILYYTNKIKKLNKENEYQSKYLQSILNAEDSLIITTDGKKIESTNQAFLDFFDVKTLDEFLIYADSICEFFTGEQSKFLQIDMNGTNWIRYLLDSSQKTHLVQIDKHHELFIFQISAAEFKIGDKQLYTIDLTDVTELEEIKIDIERQVQDGLKEINELNIEIELTQQEVVLTMGAIGESRSRETGNHVKRVAEYSKLLALEYGLDEDEAILLEQASPMHDIGKVAIPDAILNKPAKLNFDEFEIMKKHASIGYDIFKNSQRKVLKAASIVAHEHHEKYDGSGYPRGIKGAGIHIYGRITAVADVFDALGSSRIYKEAWSDERIFKLFRDESGIHFDPKLVDIFFNNFDKIDIIRKKYKDVS